MKFFKNALILFPIISSGSLMILLPSISSDKNITTMSMQSNLHINKRNSNLTSTLNPHFISSPIYLSNLKSTDQIKIMSYNHNPTFQLDKRIIIKYVLNPDLKNAKAQSQVKYEWHRIINGVDEIIINESNDPENELNIAATNNYNNAQIYLRMIILDNQGIQINEYISNKMKVWISESPQRDGEPIEYFKISRLENIPAREITASDIISIILTPENIMKIFSNIPDDYEQKACFYRPLIYGDKVKANNKNRELLITFQLGYGRVNGIDTTDANQLVQTKCQIRITGFKTVEESVFHPVNKKKMETSLNATNIVDYFKNNNFHYNTTAAGTFFTINNEPPKNEQVIKVTVMRNSFKRTIIEFTIKNVYYYDEFLDDIISGQRKIQFNIEGYEPGWTERTIRTWIWEQGSREFVDKQELTDYSKQKNNRTTASMILIGAMAAIGGILVIVILLIIFNHRNKRIIDKLYV